MFGEYMMFAEEIRFQVQKCHQEYEVTRKNISKQPGYIVDWELVDKAWKTAVLCHCSVENKAGWYRKSGELYITHPKAVMEELARLHCKSSVLAAALLHDTMEDCGVTYETLRESFSYEVAQIVQAVTAIKDEEKKADPYYATMTDQEKHDFLDNLTDAKLIASPFQREAFLVRFADRAHNLQTIEACETGKRLQKIAATRAFLIPAACRLGMRYFEVILNEWCMRFEDEDYAHNESTKLLEKRTALTKLSGGAYSQFDQALQDAITEQSIFSFPAFNPYAKLRGFSKEGGGEEMRATGRRVMLTYELKQQCSSLNCFERSKLDLWEIILTCKDQHASDMLKHFLDFFRTYLSGEEIFFEYVDKVDKGIIVRLTDHVENNYRIILLPESRLEAYFIGDHEGDRLTMIDEEAPTDALRPQMTVYSYSPKKGYRKFEKCVPYGATALDFAFIIHRELGLSAKSARIHKWNGEGTYPFAENDHRYPLGTVISEDDVVFFDADYERDEEKLVYFKENVKIDSMLLVNTQYGKNCLIHHFKAKYESK